MATTLRFEHLMEQGEPDFEGYPITIDRATYKKLPVLPKMNFLDGTWKIEPCKFREIYRDHIKDDDSFHPAVRIYREDDLIDNIYALNRQKYWYCVWVEAEKVWIVFQYYDLTSIDLAMVANVEVALPMHGDIYRPNKETTKIISKYYNLK